MGLFRKLGGAPIQPQFPPREPRPALGGAVSRMPDAQPQTQGPVSGPNAPWLIPNLLEQLGVPAPVVDVASFPAGLQTLPFVLSGNSVLAINRASGGQVRTLLLFNCLKASAGDLLVGFGQSVSTDVFWFDLPAGGMIYLDSKVPQDDVWIAGTASNTLAVVGYANFFPVGL